MAAPPPRRAAAFLALAARRARAAIARAETAVRPAPSPARLTAAASPRDVHAARRSHSGKRGARPPAMPAAQPGGGGATGAPAAWPAVDAGGGSSLSKRRHTYTRASAWAATSACNAELSGDASDAETRDSSVCNAARRTSTEAWRRKGHRRGMSPPSECSPSPPSSTSLPESSMASDGSALTAGASVLTAPPAGASNHRGAKPGGGAVADSCASSRNTLAVDALMSSKSRSVAHSRRTSRGTAVGSAAVSGATTGSSASDATARTSSSSSRRPDEMTGKASTSRRGAKSARSASR
ncbi:hypothetical protein BU14_2830s0001 [Porphyra umbilicalis]|uniref:Uncharacterized protein n=1 Tax=Porphyra umbilicalis TaxID=2786 RepID=A0A1X6NIJ2_PORUM|nr:hypothetical protein BU14_2830s0001 [Porphyra umbilicalis]|eukprot:OSX68425.1 hypothetical protein BU14_2830s0001 [Porphyra umbilicalis]